MCRDFIQKHSCPRGLHCTFAHSKAEMDKYRAKNRHPNGALLPIASSTNLVPSSTPAGSLPMYASANNANLSRPIPPSILPLWNAQQQQQQQSHLMQEIPQQHHHQCAGLPSSSSSDHRNGQVLVSSSHYYHASQIPPSILQMHGHPTAAATTSTTYEHQPQNHSNHNHSQIPVIAAAAQAILEQNNAAAAFAANNFYRFQQHQQNASIPFHPTASMVCVTSIVRVSTLVLHSRFQIAQQQQQSLLPRSGERSSEQTSDHID